MKNLRDEDPSRRLREVLREARTAAGLTQQEVGDRISAHLCLEQSFTSTAVSEWERYGQHPALTVMTAWAHVLGRRLVVEIEEPDGEQVRVVVRREVGELARLLDQLSPEDLWAVSHVIRALGRRS